MSFGEAAAYALALVLVAAALAKLQRPSGTASELAALGLIQSRVMAWAVPGAELATAAVLVVAPAWGGVMGFALLAGFTTVLLRAVRSGLVVTCTCFGGLSRRPVSQRTLARNAGLLVLAAVAATA